jgi:hypothetical protein
VTRAVVTRWAWKAVPWTLYGLLAFASFYPQSARPTTRVAYVGDAVESVYIVAWNVHQFFRDPLRLFDANVLHPLPQALAFTDHRLLPSLLVAPVVWTTGNAVLAYNVAVLLACLLAAGAARHLARVLGASGVAAWSAGALYAFHTYQVHEASRLNVIFHGFLPLALTRLILYLKTGERRQAWITAGLLLLQGLSSNYHLLYGLLLVVVVVTIALAARPRNVLRRLPVLGAAGLTAGLAFLPVAWPYLRLASTYGLERGLPQSMGIEHYWSTYPTNVLWGALGPEVRTQQRGPHFVGFVSLALALVGLAAGWRQQPRDESALLPPRAWVPAAAGLALLFVALSLGRNVVLQGQYVCPGPYRLLYDWVPGFQLVRIPERFALLAMLFVALLAARGLTVLRRPARGVPALVLAALVPLEHVSPRPEAVEVPVGRAVPEVYRWLAGQPGAAVAELPARSEGRVRDETLEMYFSTVHWRPIIHGYTAYPPLLTRVLRRAAAQFPAEAALQAFQRVGVDTVVVHHGRDVGVDLQRQVPGRGPEREERIRRLLRAAGLDLYGQLPEAVAAGRIVRVARFAGEEVLDEVYRLLPVAPRPAAPMPGGRALRGPRWRYVATAGEAGLASDGDLATAWTVVEPLRGDEVFEVAFDEPTDVAGVVLPLRWDTPFPTRFRVDGRGDDGEWRPLARFGEAQLLQLLDTLLADPRRAAIGFAFDARGMLGLRLAVEAGGTSFDGWAIPEIEVRVP